MIRLRQTLARLNAVHDKIQFTVEEEECQKLPFLDTMIYWVAAACVFKYTESKPRKKISLILFHCSITKADIWVTIFDIYIYISGTRTGDWIRDKKPLTNSSDSVIYLVVLLEWQNILKWNRTWHSGAILWPKVEFTIWNHVNEWQIFD